MRICENKTTFCSACTLILLLSAFIPARCADWPMWRCDAGRTACSGEELPGEISLLWERYYSPRTMVWDDPLNHDLMPYDRVFEPVVSGKRMFVPFNDRDKVVALDVETGRELWAFYTGGPVRFPPSAWEGRVFFTCDDGYLYCLDAGSGNLVWKFRGGPSESKILGNKRLISTWPSRGGPVVADGTVYFAAGIWPLMGTFIYALDAETGRLEWINDRTGSEYILQPHNSPSFAGVAPQGAMVATDTRLLVPGGRSVPACFDRAGGEELYYRLASSGKTGGSFVCAAGEVFFNHHRDQVCTMYDLENGHPLIRQLGRNPVLSGEEVYIVGKSIAAYDAARIRDKSRRWREARLQERAFRNAVTPDLGPAPRLTLKYYIDWRDVIDKLHEEWLEYKSRQWEESLLWRLAADGSNDLIRAGNRLYAAGPQGVTAIELPANREAGPEIAWEKKVAGGVERLLAADNKLFAVTLDGRIMAFGGKGESAPVRIPKARAAGRKKSREAGRKALSILRQTGVREGYALVYGPGDNGLIEELARNSELKIVAVVPDSATVDRLRRSLDAAGLYGERIAVHQGELSTFQAPPYMASLTVVSSSVTASLAAAGDSKASWERICRSVRPYGGKALLETRTAETQARVAGDFETLGMAGFKAASVRGAVVLTRSGPLPGAAGWTHQYGNIANTVKSEDSLVRLPLGILWFGGNSNMDVLPRHGHGPPEQVAGGRLFIEGHDCLSARDVYTGRVLWKVTIKGLGNFGVYYDESYHDTPASTAYNQEHIPGANVRGTNFVATADRVYIVERGRARVLDAATGRTVMFITLPPGPNSGKPLWGYIGISGDYLIGGREFVSFSASMPRDPEIESRLEKLTLLKRRVLLAFHNYDRSASRGLVVFNRHTGKALWSIEARHGFLHNAIAADGDRLFCLDKPHPYVENRLKRRGAGGGEKNTRGSRLMTLGLRSGEILWENNEKIFGSWLSYSAEHDILLQSTRPSRDMVRGETGRRMIAYKAGDGAVLWDKELDYSSVPIIHRGKIITRGRMTSLLTGEPIYRDNPLTGERIPVTWRRNYGCNYPIASENMLTFRSAAAGFYNLVNHGGTGSFGGFKSGCTSNLIAADGVLNAPDYTRTCSCSYQNQTSLALVNMPEVEIWTFNDIEMGAGPVKRVGINLGAPGDRVAPNGTLWLDYPSRGGPSPKLPVSIKPENPEWFCHHSSLLESGELKWVAASGVKGIGKITVILAEKPGKARPYTVRLYFAETCYAPQQKSLAPRVFDLALQGQNVLKGFDILTQAGGPNRTVVKEFKNILVNRDLTLTFNSSSTINTNKPSICGIEIIAESW